MLIEVLAYLVALRSLIASYLLMSFFELLVLRLVFSGDLLVLLLDSLGFGTLVLMLQVLLVEELLIHLRIDASHIDFSYQRYNLIQEDVFEFSCAFPAFCLNLAHFRHHRAVGLLESGSFLTILIRLVWLGQLDDLLRDHLARHHTSNNIVTG